MNNNVFSIVSWRGSWGQVTEERIAVWPKPGRALDELEGHDTHRHEERKKWCRARAGNEPRIYRSPSGGCGCCCCSRIFRRRASTTGFSYWVFLFIWLSQRERKQHNKGKDWLEKKRINVSIYMWRWFSLRFTEGEKRFVRGSLIWRNPVFLWELMWQQGD